MPFPGQPPELPAANPTGVYERDVRGPAGLGGRRIVLHVGAAESVLIVAVNGDDIGVSKDSHLAAEFDVTGRRRPGPEHPALTVVKWSDATYVEDQDQWWHGGITRSVFLYATGPVHLADIGAIGRSRATTCDRHARPHRRRRLRRRRGRPAGSWRRRSRGC